MMRRRMRRSVSALVGAIAMATMLLIGMQVAFASHSEVSLAGSNFEIDSDANIKADDPAPSIDWGNVNENRKADSPSGANDESFGQGTKESTAAPVVVDGSIPPNKSDLKVFGLYQEGGTTSGFLNLFWSRVQDPAGTTNMDFELNKRQCTAGDPTDNDCTANGITPKRSTGDLLIIYDLSQGGTNPTLSLRRWTANDNWSAATDLTAANDATGSINSSSIPSGESDGLGAQDPRTFGEAQIALSAIFGASNGCTSFGSAYLKSRSSDSFTAALKDFVPPVAVNISNCGSVKIIKKDDAGSALAGAEFTLYKDNDPVGGSRGNEDTATTQKCTTAANGECTISNVLAGEYWVVETVTPSGHDTAADQHASVTADSTVTLTFVNPRQLGAIEVTKTAKHQGTDTSTRNLQATFTVKQGSTTIGTIQTDGTTGEGCLGNLVQGSYTVEETSGPSGYAKDTDTETVAVNNKASCDLRSGTASTAGEQVGFENVPLTNITVSAQSQVGSGTANTADDATASKITCTNQTPTPSDTTPNAFDDTSETVVGLQPGTYTCTVVVDP